jgi:hypothetical protein
VGDYGRKKKEAIRPFGALISRLFLMLFLIKFNRRGINFLWRRLGEGPGVL